VPGGSLVIETERGAGLHLTDLLFPMLELVGTVLHRELDCLVLNGRRNADGQRDRSQRARPRRFWNE